MRKRLLALFEAVAFAYRARVFHQAFRESLGYEEFTELLRKSRHCLN